MKLEDAGQTQRKEERWMGGEETAGVTKQRMIVSNWDGSQSVTSENSQSYPFISSLSSVTCLLFPRTPSASGTHTYKHNTHNTHTHTYINTLSFTALFLLLCLSQSPTLKSHTLLHTHKQPHTQITMTHRHKHAPAPRGRTVCLS